LVNGNKTGECRIFNIETGHIKDIVKELNEMIQETTTNFKTTASEIIDEIIVCQSDNENLIVFPELSRSMEETG